MTRRILPLTPALLLTLTLGMGPVAFADLVDGIVTATGTGIADGNRFPVGVQARMMSRRAAMVDAQRNLLEITNGVRLTAGTTVENMMVTSDRVGTRVKGLLEGAFVIDEKSYEEAGNWITEVELALCVNSRPPQCTQAATLMEAVRDTLATDESAAEPFRPEPAAASPSSPGVPDETDAPDPADPAMGTDMNTATGLIVDLRSFDYTPMLDVRIRTQSGQELYGPAHVGADTTEWLNWARSMEKAVAMTEVVGPAPMVIPASGLDDDAHVLVSSEHANRIYRHDARGGNFLRDGKVVFVVR